MYLLDTSVASAAAHAGNQFHQKATDFLSRNELFAPHTYISVVTIGESRFGVELLKYPREQPIPQTRIDEVREAARVLAQAWQALPITEHIAKTYGSMRAALANQQVGKKVREGRNLKGTHVEKWHNDIRSPDLQISENDVWIAATAVTHDLTLVACDGDFKRIRTSTPELQVVML